jgi:cyclic beta-1,2-glucan synthetase
MTLMNGLGGFTDGGRAYAVVLEGDDETPMPWTNVISNARFGTIVTASGASHTWSENSRENRLTSFANDPIVDPTSEAVFVRDDDSGDAWSPTPGPMRRDRTSGRFVIRHAAGVTEFARTTRGIRHRLDVFVDVEDPVKYSRLTVTNESGATRRLSVFAYNDWALGPPRDGHHRHVTTTRDVKSGAILARNAYNDAFAPRIAFAHASQATASATGSRVSFIGRNGSLARPRALGHSLLDGRFGAGLDPCAVLQVQLVLKPRAARRALRARSGSDAAHVEQLIERHGTLDAGDAARQRVRISGTVRSARFRSARPTIRSTS